ncbi:unnamed protein product [Pieris macdunnoughi]|uniref:Uncharacterized protein n=1 Tax=Pieris macdunnoughi TaxID=345717 RepID=A0A821UU81_9NEOP|nr:unnamed protein product [Pieris macdunnoughi]
MHRHHNTRSLLTEKEQLIIYCHWLIDNANADVNVLRNWPTLQVCREQIAVGGKSPAQMRVASTPAKPLLRGGQAAQNLKLSARAIP